MNITVLLDGTDITTSVISYDRDKALCTGIGQLRLETLGSVNGEIYNEIELYEDDTKKGTYYIHTIDNNVPSNTKTFSAQDASLKLNTYFISEYYEIDYDSTSDYWIKKFLDDATIAWAFDVSDTGTLLNNNTTLGLCSAADAITPLLQQNGWYLSFDGNNVARIGRITDSPDNYSQTLTSSNIISVSANEHDKMFRNRIVVWGGTNRNGQWIYSDYNRSGNYENEYDANDTRTAVIANSNIKDLAAANAIALRAMEEWDKTNYEITVDYAGAIDLDIGQYVYIDAESIQRVGMVTNIGSSLSANGLITHVVVNQRCPRLFAYYDFGGYVYVGTQGSGVWRKPINISHTWVNFSTGLTDLNIVDLIIDNGVYACIGASGQLFIRTAGSAAWVPFTPSVVDTFGTNTILPSSLIDCKSVTIDKTNGDIIAGFSTNSGDARSWIYRIRSSSNYTSYQFYDTEDIPGYTILSLDNNGTSNIVSVVENYSGIPALNYGGARQVTPNFSCFPNTLSGMQGGYSGVLIYENNGDIPTTLPSSKAVFGDGKYLYIRHRGYALSEYAVFSGIDEGNVSSVQVVGGSFEDNSGAPAGNRGIVSAYYKDGKNHIKSSTNAFSKDVEFGNEDSFFTGMTIPTSGGLYYFSFSLQWDGSNYDGVTVTRWQIGEDYAVERTTRGFDNSVLGGTFTSAGYDAISSLAYSDNRLTSVVYAGYSNVVIDSTPVGTTDFPVVVTYDITTNQLQFVSLHSFATVSYPNPSIQAYTSKGGEVFVLLYSDGNYQILKISRTGTVTVTDNENTEAYYELFIANEDRVFIPKSQGGATRYDVIDAETGTIYDTVNRSPGDKVFSHQISQEGLYMVYDSVSGDINCRTLVSGIVPYSGGSFTMDTNFPTYDNGFYTLNARHSLLSLIHDTVYLEVSSSYNNNEYYSIGIYVPSSGARYDMPVNYTVYVNGEYRIMHGLNANPYSMIYDSALDYAVEISEMNPIVLFGNSAYSGIVMGGIQTGYSQAHVLASPYGSANSFSRYTFNSLHSQIGDVRTETMMVDSGDIENPYYGSWMLTPVVDAQFPDETSTTQLFAVDLTTLSNSAAAYSVDSEIAPGNTVVLDTFAGYANHVETTKNPDFPYIFVSVSGVPPTFFQKDGHYVGEVDTTFIDRTNNLPSAAINIIRVDDQI